ncbi:MAG: hypothetical protein HY659_14555 [Rhizobiales bacterium]|nr:hypothetical protein [Hyphomicrobiales bacterium]
MKGRIASALLFSTLAATVARSGHELPIYPSYYPHEIKIETVTPERAAAMLTAGQIQAQVGAGLRFAETPPQSIRNVESLGSFVSVRLNPSSTFARTERDACAAVGAIARDIAASRKDLVFHPYPVTPFHGDYLHHVDLAEVAKVRLAAENTGAAAPRIGDLKIRADRALAARLGHPNWAALNEWDAEVAEASAADLMASATLAVNGWLGPSWLKAGWFYAHLLLARSSGDVDAEARIGGARQQLQAGAYDNAVERINLERALVTELTRDCRNMIVGYTVKREYFTDEFSAGIENIAYDSISGLNSAIFVRTVKLKDFPWNGWLSLGVDAVPSSAWNPISGFSDPFGRLMWSAVGDSALLPSPYDSEWMLNRISDVQATPVQ